MGIDGLPSSITDSYEVLEWKHSVAILTTDYQEELGEILDVLSNFHLLRSDIEAPGGGRSPISKKLDTAFYDLAWEHKSFDTKVVVDGKEMISPTHKVDCVKREVALEI